jgi:hypothetical protein
MGGETVMAIRFEVLLWWVVFQVCLSGFIWGCEYDAIADKDYLSCHPKHMNVLTGFTLPITTLIPDYQPYFEFCSTELTKPEKQ